MEIKYELVHYLLKVQESETYYVLEKNMLDEQKANLSGKIL